MSMNLVLVHFNGKTVDENFHWQTETEFTFKVLNTNTIDDIVDLFKEWFARIVNFKNPEEVKEYHKNVNYIKCKLKEGYKFHMT